MTTTTTQPTAHIAPSAAHRGTDVASFISDLDAGNFENMLSIAISHVAAAVVLHGKQGKVSIDLALDHIKGSAAQVTCAHQLKFTLPTADGKQSEEAKRSTLMHVNKGGRLSIVPEAQADMFKPQAQA